MSTSRTNQALARSADQRPGPLNAVAMLDPMLERTLHGSCQLASQSESGQSTSRGRPWRYYVFRRGIRMLLERG